MIVFCQHCNKLSSVVEIRSPSVLRKIIALADTAIKDGVLTDISVRYPFPSSPFQDVAAGGTWDDHVSYHFECQHCHALFHLEAETYHGSGGSWSQISVAAAL